MVGERKDRGELMWRVGIGMDRPDEGRAGESARVRADMVRSGRTCRRWTEMGGLDWHVGVGELGRGLDRGGWGRRRRPS